MKEENVILSQLSFDCKRAILDGCSSMASHQGFVPRLHTVERDSGRNDERKKNLSLKIETSYRGINKKLNNKKWANINYWYASLMSSWTDFEEKVKSNKSLSIEDNEKKWNISIKFEINFLSI